jgi:hypothetical protein
MAQMGALRVLTDARWRKSEVWSVAEAAFARAGGYRLLTFDRGFRQFEGLDVEILSAV